ncbi:helix-turn-helix domain-containing protein [Burkholderia cenocepacia]|uniref:helix-turn-helix domain-containing protein n=1 Tax=Burkholderia cenocepacia TaxID=95486 RepID=UPI00055903DB|nr:helix-turn-helix domain-containing protein [Burkholderia cenocepacia]
MNIFDSIGARLREERERLGYSQTAVAELAEKAGVKGATRQSQALYEKGQRMPDAAFLAVVQGAGYDVAYVLTGQRSGAVAPTPALKPEEAALLDNYRHASPEGKKAIKATSDALAKPSSGSGGKKSA